MEGTHRSARWDSLGAPWWGRGTRRYRRRDLRYLDGRRPTSGDVQGLVMSVGGVGSRQVHFASPSYFARFSAIRIRSKTVWSQPLCTEPARPGIPDHSLPLNQTFPGHLKLAQPLATPDLVTEFGINCINWRTIRIPHSHQLITQTAGCTTAFFSRPPCFYEHVFLARPRLMG